MTDFEPYVAAARYAAAARLEAWASDKGLTPPGAYFITGFFNLKTPAGESVYSDEALNWCHECGSAQVAKIVALFPEAQQEDDQGDPRLFSTDCADEDESVACAECCKTLRYSLSKYGVEEELAHFEDNPLEGELTAEDAYAISKIITAWSPGNSQRFELAEAALALIENPINSQLNAVSV